MRIITGPVFFLPVPPGVRHEHTHCRTVGAFTRYREEPTTDSSLLTSGPIDPTF